MFNGAVTFKRINGCWTVCSVTSSEFWRYGRDTIYRFGVLTVHGDFNFKPRCGFSLPPHKLMNWSK